MNGGIMHYSVEKLGFIFRRARSGERELKF
jgi:hypothetical protein